MRLLVVLALLGLLAACRPPDEGGGTAGRASSDGVTVAMEIESEAVVGRAPVRVSVQRDSEGVSGASVEVIGEMTHAGMVPVIAEAREVEPGVYRAEDFEFNMAGDWVVSAEVSLGSGEELRAVRSLSVRQP